MKNHSQNVVAKIFLDLFLTNQSWAYLWSNSLNFHTVCFYCMPSWGISKNIETKQQTTCFYFNINFSKSKRGLEPISLPHFLDDSWRKIFILLYSFDWPNFIAWLPFLREVLGNMGIVTVFNHTVTSQILKLTLAFKSRRFFYMTKNPRQELKYLENEKNLKK